jgi:uncharacterized protein
MTTGVVTALAMLLMPSPQTTAPAAAAPSFDCAKASTGVERLICRDAGLASRDRALAAAYAKALKAWPESLQAEQRAAHQDWIDGRNECVKTTNVKGCVEWNYQRRLIEVQILSAQLVAPLPVTYACKGRESDRIAAAFYRQTDPPSAVITVGDRQAIALSVSSPGGTRYIGQDVELREQQGGVTLTWSGIKIACKVR